MIIIGWVMALGLLTLFFSRYLSQQRNPNQQVIFSEIDGEKQVSLQRNRLGHYVANGQINNQPVTFLVDTGATHISIPGKVARRLGLESGMAMPVETANGRIQVYVTKLDSVFLGGIELRDIKANINPYMDNEEVLMGMSFLKYLNFSQEGDQLLIRQY